MPQAPQLAPTANSVDTKRGTYKSETAETKESIHKPQKKGERASAQFVQPSKEETESSRADRALV